MKRRSGYLAIAVWVLAALAVGTVWAATGAQPLAREEGALARERIDPGQLVLEPFASYEQAVVTLVGPDGYRVRRVFGAGEPVRVTLLAADGSPFRNGRYRYTLQVSPQPADLPARQVGIFFVGEGEAVSRRSKRAELAGVRAGLDEMRDQQLGQFERRPSARGEDRVARIPSDAQASETAVPAPQGMVATDYLTIDGSSGYSPTVNFAEYGYAQAGTIYQYNGNLYRYAVANNFDFGATNRRVGSVANRDYAGYQLRQGHSIKDFGIYTDRIGLINYTYGFVNHVYGLYGNYFYAGRPPFYTYPFSYPVFPGIMTFVSYGYQYTGAYGPQIDGGSMSFWSRVYTPTDEVYSTLGMHVTPYGVGVGTMKPTSDIEIYDYDFAALRLHSYQGDVYFTFSATPLGDFTVNKIGTGGQEFTVKERFDVLGPTMQVQGSVQGTQFIAYSSREMKTDFGELDAQEILNKLDSLPIRSWRYKTDKDSVRHFGPVAEDFRAAFQLGDGRHISNVDASGVTMAAIQGLYDVVREREAALLARLEDRDAELASLRREVAELRRLLVTEEN